MYYGDSSFFAPARKPLHSHYMYIWMAEKITTHWAQEHPLFFGYTEHESNPYLHAPHAACDLKKWPVDVYMSGRQRMIGKLGLFFNLWLRTCTNMRFLDSEAIECLDAHFFSPNYISKYFSNKLGKLKGAELRRSASVYLPDRHVLAKYINHRQPLESSRHPARDRCFSQLALAAGSRKLLARTLRPRVVFFFNFSPTSTQGFGLCRSNFRVTNVFISADFRSICQYFAIVARHLSQN